MDKLGSMDRLEKLKANSIENPGKQKRTKCTTCKKPKEVVVEKAPLPFELEPEIYIPTVEDIKLAYAELTSFGGVKEDKKDFIQKVYQALFNEEFIFNCGGCGKGQVRKFTHHLNNIGIL
jgi:hypothetical protein